MDSEKRDTAVEGISKFAFERVEAAYERNIKRLWVIILILLALLTAAITGGLLAIKSINDKWVSLIEQYDTESYAVEADGNSVANFVGDDMRGDINYGGENKSAENDKTVGSAREDDAGER